jgi:hypothetical protein
VNVSSEKVFGGGSSEGRPAVRGSAGSCTVVCKTVDTVMAGRRCIAGASCGRLRRYNNGWGGLHSRWGSLDGCSGPYIV